MTMGVTSPQRQKKSEPTETRRNLAGDVVTAPSSSFGSLQEKIARGDVPGITQEGSGSQDFVSDPTYGAYSTTSRGSRVTTSPDSLSLPTRPSSMPVIVQRLDPQQLSFRDQVVQGFSQVVNSPNVQVQNVARTVSSGAERFDPSNVIQQSPALQSKIGLTGRPEVRQDTFENVRGNLEEVQFRGQTVMGKRTPDGGIAIPINPATGLPPQASFRDGTPYIVQTPRQVSFADNFTPANQSDIRTSSDTMQADQTGGGAYAFALSLEEQGRGITNRLSDFLFQGTPEQAGQRVVDQFGDSGVVQAIVAPAVVGEAKGVRDIGAFPGAVLAGGLGILATKEKTVIGTGKGIIVGTGKEFLVSPVETSTSLLTGGEILKVAAPKSLVKIGGSAYEVGAEFTRPLAESTPVKLVTTEIVKPTATALGDTIQNVKSATIFRASGELINSAKKVGTDAIDTAKALGSKVPSGVSSVGQNIGSSTFVGASKELVQSGIQTGKEAVQTVSAGSQRIGQAASNAIIVVKTSGVGGATIQLAESAGRTAFDAGRSTVQVGRTLGSSTVQGVSNVGNVLRTSGYGQGLKGLREDAATVYDAGRRGITNVGSQVRVGVENVKQSSPVGAARQLVKEDIPFAIQTVGVKATDAGKFAGSFALPGATIQLTQSGRAAITQLVNRVVVASERGALRVDNALYNFGGGVGFQRVSVPVRDTTGTVSDKLIYSGFRGRLGSTEYPLVGNVGGRIVFGRPTGKQLSEAGVSDLAFAETGKAFRPRSRLETSVLNREDVFKEIGLTRPKTELQEKVNPSIELDKLFGNQRSAFIREQFISDVVGLEPKEAKVIVERLANIRSGELKGSFAQQSQLSESAVKIRQSVVGKSGDIDFSVPTQEIGAASAKYVFEGLQEVTPNKFRLKDGTIEKQGVGKVFEAVTSKNLKDNAEAGLVPFLEGDVAFGRRLTKPTITLEGVNTQAVSEQIGRKLLDASLGFKEYSKKTFESTGSDKTGGLSQLRTKVEAEGTIKALGPAEFRVKDIPDAFIVTKDLIKSREDTVTGRIFRGKAEKGKQLVQKLEKGFEETLGIKFDTDTPRVVDVTAAIDDIREVPKGSSTSQIQQITSVATREIESIVSRPSRSEVQTQEKPSRVPFKNEFSTTSRLSELARSTSGRSQRSSPASRSSRTSLTTSSLSPISVAPSSASSLTSAVSPPSRLPSSGISSSPRTSQPSRSSRISPSSLPSYASRPSSPSGSSTPSVPSYTSPRPPSKPPTSLFPRGKDKSTIAQPKEESGFNVKFRKGGKIVDLGVSLTEENALKLGSRIAESTAVRSFKVDPSNRAAVDTDVTGNFNPSKYQAGKTKTTEGFNVQRSKFAISSAGEKREITQKGIEARKRLRL